MQIDTLLRYMKAWVRMNAKPDVSALSPEDLMDCFSILPKPAVPLEQFAAVVGASLLSPEEQEQEKVINMQKHSANLGSKVWGFAQSHTNRKRVTETEAEAVNA
jgi:hypothetical protein